MHSRQTLRILWIATFVFTGLLSASCTQQYSSYAILLWSPDEENIESGSIVGLSNHSELKNTYEIAFISNPETSSSVVTPSNAGQDSGSTADPAVPKKNLVVEAWRLKIFGNEGDARSWSKDNSIYARQFAKSLRQALPVRQKADRNTAMVYRLREGELAKIVDRADEVSNEGGLTGYWYEIITETGMSGWVFSAQLDIVDLASAGTSTIVSDDPKLQRILTANWRPEEFGAMIEYKRYDLTVFNPRNGLFVDSAKKIARIVLPKEQMDFNFSSIEKLRGDNYQVSGTSLQLSFRDDKSIVAQWTKSSSVKSHVFVATDISVTDIYNAELARRETMYQSFLKNGGTIQSDSYGSITLNPDHSFNWFNLDALQPRIVPRSASGNGTVGFDYYLSAALQGQYQGAVTFSFSTSSDAERVTFLYNVRGDGIQLEYVSTTGLRDLVIPRSELSPTVLFFHF